MNLSSRVVVLLALLIALPIKIAHSAVPTVLHYQGVITDGIGTPITINTSVTFTLWSAPIGGTSRWQEARNITPDSEGRFAVLLGEAVPLHDSVFKMPAFTSLYLGVQVAADPELTPRSQIASGAFAFRISTVDGATGGTIAGNVELLTDGSGSGLGIRDPGGNVSSMSSTSTAFADANEDTIAQFGDVGVLFIEPSTGDTVFHYDPTLNSLEIGAGNVVTAVQAGAIGTGNIVRADNSFAIGTVNMVDSANSFAIGNSCHAWGRNSFASGQNNYAIGENSACAGGQDCVALGFGSFVGAGFWNRAEGHSSGVASGTHNWSLDDASVVGGGSYNKALADYTTVAGGGTNTASGILSTVGGGYINMASGAMSTVCGGREDTASGAQSTVGGGYRNNASGSAATVPGGVGNTAAGNWSLAAGYFASALHTGSFVWGDFTDNSSVASSADNQWTARASGGVRFYSSGDLSTGVTLAPGDGSWASVSDRNLKRNVESVSGEEVLEKLSRIPITKWSYLTQDDSIRHIGPMAQDFRAAFGVGLSDKTITTIDADGVALAAIQALYEKQKSENQELRDQLKQLREAVEKLSRPD